MPAAQALPPRFNFLLQPEFPLNALVLASEALRIANQNSGRTLFSWQLFSEDGEPVRASNGMWMSVDGGVHDAPRADYYLVFEGNLGPRQTSPKFLNLLRSAIRFGATVVGIDTGAFAMAEAGLVGERKALVHWETVHMFRERFPDLAVDDQLYLLDGQRAYAAGGVATLDLMLALISRHYDQALANEVANALLHTPRIAATPQRLDVEKLPPTVTSATASLHGDARHSKGAGPRLLSDRLVHLMEGNLDFPLSLEALAEKLNMSSRTVTRECRRRFDQTPMALYLRIRLQSARNMLFYQQLSINDVALACGFSYSSAFSRAFKQQFGATPRTFRAEIRRQQSQAVRPEIRRLSLSIRPKTAD